jgi:hypothetical protein
VEKCTFCAERLAGGLPPACVLACRRRGGGALRFGDLEDPHSEVSRLLGARKNHALIPGAGTKPQIFYLDSEILEDVDKQLKELKKAGVNTLIVRVFQNKGDRPFKFANPRCDEGVYFKTDYAPVVDDVLGRLVDLSHRNELDLFAWITTRYSDFNSDGNVEHRVHSYNFETKRVEPARGLTVFHPDVVTRLDGIFRDLGRYPIDGILFQDDLILRHNEDFGPVASKAFL